MIANTKTVLALLSGLLTCALAFGADQPITLSDGVSEWAEPVLILKLGNIAAAQTREITLRVTPSPGTAPTSVPHIWVFCEGRFLSCTWDGGARGDSEKILSAPADLKLAFAVAAPEKDPKTGLLTVVREAAEVLIVDKNHKPLKW